MTAELRASASPGELRVALLRDGALAEYALSRPGAPDGVGDLHRGRITARRPALAGAFVALAGLAPGVEGFLPDSAGAAGRSEGELLAVRVTRAAQGGKGPRLDARGTDEEAASGPVRLVRRGPDALVRLAEAHADAAILVDDPSLLAALPGALRQRATVCRTAWGAPLEEAVAALAEPYAELPGGMRAGFFPTPALTAIDLDTGAGSGERRGKAASQLAANRAALPALARQIVLRNLGGAIVIDLAGMKPGARAALAPELAAALAMDRLRPRLLGFTALGLAEIVRPRIHAPLHEMMTGPHAAGLAALRAVAAGATAAATPALHAAPNVHAALAADRIARESLARRTGRPLLLHMDTTLPPCAWRLAAVHG